MHPTLSRSPRIFPAFLPVDASIKNSSAFLQPKCSPEIKSICKAKARSRKPLEQNRPNNKVTIVKVCRAAPHDSQQPVYTKNSNNQIQLNHGGCGGMMGEFPDTGGAASEIPWGSGIRVFFLTGILIQSDIYPMDCNGI